jgi:dTDP-glucose 4,6-dehydratase
VTLLVTGGAGFIGSNFVRTWVATSAERIINLDKLTYAGNQENLSGLETNRQHTFIRGDIGDGELVRHLLAEHKPRIVVNFAAESHVDRSILGPAEFIRTNILGTFSLLESVRTYWSSLPENVSSGSPSVTRSGFRYIQVSTDEVYGSLAPDDAPVVEASPYSPRSPYAASKAAADHLVSAWHYTYRVPTLTTNCSNNYGPYQFPEKLIPLLILNALAGKALPLYGDGLQIRDWLYVEDHCRAITCVLENGEIGSTYNIGSGCGKTNMEVALAVSAILDRLRPRENGAPYANLIAFVKDRPGHDRRYAIDSGKICRTLGWKPSETFDSGLEKTVHWYLSNEKWIAGVLNGSYRQWVDKQYG